MELGRKPEMGSRYLLSAELIVVVDLLAPDHVSANLVRLGIKTNANDIKILIGVTEIDLGFLGDGRAVFGISLNKTFDLEHLAGEGR